MSSKQFGGKLNFSTIKNFLPYGGILWLYNKGPIDISVWRYIFQIIQMLQVEPKKIHDIVQLRNSDGKYDIYRIAHLPVDIKIQHGLL